LNRAFRHRVRQHGAHLVTQTCKDRIAQNRKRNEPKRFVTFHVLKRDIGIAYAPITPRIAPIASRHWRLVVVIS
jgi:hypothetical protein